MAIIWKKKEALRCDFNVPADTIPGWYHLQTKTIGQHAITKSLFVFENGVLAGYYLPKKELRKIATLTLRAVLENPTRIDRVHKRATDLNWQYFRFAEKIRKLDLTKLTNRQLLKLHSRLFRLQMLSHCYAQPTTWFVDSDGNDLTNYLMNFLKRRIQATRERLDFAAAFSILTTPSRITLGSQEEKESLQILEWIQKQAKVKNWFLAKNRSPLSQKFTQLPAAARSKLYRHYYKWTWLPYAYTGPPYSLDYYLDVWRGLLRERVNPQKEIKGKSQQALETRRRHAVLFKKLKFSGYEKKLFDTAADIVWLKGFRKDCYFHGFFVLDLILAEIGKRTGLALKQVKFLLPLELPLALRGKDLTNLVNERINFSLLYGVKGRIKALSGRAAHVFLKKFRFQRERRESFGGKLFGTCACPGAARGAVRIVNYPEEMGRMKSGDIMLATQTYPSLVPAMKKAAAIVTEEGGLTCHAAIVSRELKIPCIVGIKGLLTFLKDGDRIEVDANKGVVRKL